MAALFPLLLTLSVMSSGFTFVNPPVPGSFPHLSMRSQINLFENRPNLFERVYEVVVVQGCPPVLFPGQNITGKIAVTIDTAKNGKCGYREISNFFSQFSPAGIMYVTADATRACLGEENPYALASKNVPQWCAGGDNSVTLGEISSILPFGLLAPNATILLDYPSQNSVMQGIWTPGSWWQINYLSTALGLVVMLLATWKLAIFVNIMGVQFAVPHIVLICCFCSGFFQFLVIGLFGNFFSSSQNLVAFDTQDLLGYMSVGFLYTATLVLGFYFAEIAKLTSQPTIPGLSLMKIPAIIFIVILWAVIWSFQIVENLDPTQNRRLLIFGFVWLGVIVPLFCSVILIYGCLSLASALSGTTSKVPIIRVMVLSFIVLLCIWTFLLVFFVMNFNPGFDPQLTKPWSDMKADYFLGLRTLLLTLGSMLPCIAICLNFVSSVQKEIEVSKSATSSTSSGRSATSSSSSSAREDPVIEL